MKSLCLILLLLSSWNSYAYNGKACKKFARTKNQKISREGQLTGDVDLTQVECVDRERAYRMHLTIGDIDSKKTSLDIKMAFASKIKTQIFNSTCQDMDGDHWFADSIQSSFEDLEGALIANVIVDRSECASIKKTRHRRATAYRSRKCLLIPMQNKVQIRIDSRSS